MHANKAQQTGSIEGNNIRRPHEMDHDPGPMKPNAQQWKEQGTVQYKHQMTIVQALLLELLLL